MQGLCPRRIIWAICRDQLFDSRFVVEVNPEGTTAKNGYAVAGQVFCICFCWAVCLYRKRSDDDEARDVRKHMPLVTILYPHIRDCSVDRVSVGTLHRWAFYGDIFIGLIHNLEFAPTEPAFPNSDERQVATS